MWTWWESQKGKREKGSERLFEEKEIADFPNLMKYMNITIQETHRIPSKVNSKRPTLRYIIIKFQKVKQESWKQEREMNHHIQGILNNIIYRLLIRNVGSQQAAGWDIQTTTKKKTYQEFYIPQYYPSEVRN